MSCRRCVLVLSATLVLPPDVHGAPAETATYDIAYDAYLYAYPLVVMDVSMRQATNVPDATTVAGRAPVNQFRHSRRYPDPAYQAVPTTNFDTLYSTAWLDVSREPIILSVPDTDGRYYLLQLLDLWTDVFDAPGWRTTGTGAGAYAIVGPGWTGHLPRGVAELRAPTPRVWIIGRTRTDGPADYANVWPIQDGYVLTPLSRWDKPHRKPEPPPPIDPTVDDTTPPLQQVAAMTLGDGLAFFEKFAELLETVPPHPNDRPILHRMRAIGITPGDAFVLPPGVDPAVVERAARDALTFLTNKQKGGGLGGNVVHGWTSITDNMGTYGTSYLRRALVAMVGLGANLPADAVYPAAYVDGDGQPLRGTCRYVMHFEDAAAWPPADAFWSVTLYDKDNFVVLNELRRYALADRDVQRNPDGSLDLYIQSDSPGAALESNWLPIGERLTGRDPDPTASHAFHLTARLYAPGRSVLDGSWAMPPVQRLECP